MTDLTDQDRRAARKWAERIIAHPIPGDHTLLDEDAAARIIIATVEAPAPTLAEELREFAKWVENPIWRETKAKVESMADRAEQIEQERDEALAEVERLTAERDRIASGRHITYTEVDGELLPDPADVPAGQPWLVQDNDGTTQDSGSSFAAIAYDDPGTPTRWRAWDAIDQPVKLDDTDIKLFARLVPEVDMTHILTDAAKDIAKTFADALGIAPAPRVITNPDELDALADDTIIRDIDDGEALQKINGWWIAARKEATGGFLSEHIGHATILWEPNA